MSVGLGVKLIQKLKDRNPLLIKLIAAIFVILLCLNLPTLFFWTLCLKQDLDIPPDTEVIVSSCKRPTVIGVPGGELLFVHEEVTDSMYLLDLRTGHKRKLSNDLFLYDEIKLMAMRTVFLSNELVWLEGSIVGPEHPDYRPHYILDLTDGQRYELSDLMSLPRLEDNKFNPDDYSYIQSADLVFIDPSKDELIALSADFRTNQSGRVILEGHITDDGEFLLQLAKDLKVDYVNVDSEWAGPRSNNLSPTGTLYVLKNGIYLSKTDELFDAIPFWYYFRSWYYDESGVVIHDNYGTYWLQPRYMGEYGLNIYHLSYPVLKLRLPEP